MSGKNQFGLVNILDFFTIQLTFVLAQCLVKVKSVSEPLYYKVYHIFGDQEPSFKFGFVFGFGS